MAKLTISDAARVTGVSRVTLHRYIKAGKLSRTPDGLIDTAELLRIGLVLQADTLQQPVTVQRPATPPVTAPSTPPVTAPDSATLQQLIEVLQRELAAAHTREEAAREREAMLLQMLQQVQQQNQRLLEAPRPAPVPTAPTSRTGASADVVSPMPGVAPAREALPSRSTVRQRLLAVLREHPEGLTAAELRVLLRADRSLSDTCAGMLRDGLVRRVQRGRYVVA